MKIARRRLFGLVAAIAAVGTVKPAQAERSHSVPPNTKMLMIAPGWDGKGWA